MLLIIKQSILLHNTIYCKNYARDAPKYGVSMRKTCLLRIDLGRQVCKKIVAAQRKSKCSFVKSVFK